MMGLDPAVGLVEYTRDRLKPYLVETNVLRLLPEALTAEVEAVLPDETGPVPANTAGCESAFCPGSDSRSHSDGKHASPIASFFPFKNPSLSNSEFQ